MVKNIALLFFLSISFLTQAQEPVSIHLSEKSGLQYKEFYDIFEDDEGFIWLCANKGLLRYDGREFKLYKHSKQRGLSVFGVKQDSLGRIWCQNISGQFFYVQDNEMHLFIDVKEHLKGELPSFIINNNSLLLFCGSKIYKINLNTKLIEVPWINNSSVSSPLETHEGIFFTNEDSLVHISPKGNFEKILSTHLPAKSKNGETITFGKAKIFKSTSSLFLLESRFGLNTFFRFNISKKNLTKMKGVETLEDKIIYTSFDNKNEIWFGTNHGVWIYEIKNDQFQFKKQFLKDKKISKIVKDQEGNYFFTTLHNGIYVIPNMHIEDCQISEENKNINSLDIINDNTLVFGTNAGSVGIYNTTTNKHTHIETGTKGHVSTLKYHKKTNVIFISKSYSAFTLNYNNFELKKVKTRGFLNAKSLTILKNDDLLLTDYKAVRVFKEGNLDNDTLIYSKRTYASHYNKDKNEVYIAFVDNLVKYDSAWNPTVIQHKNKALLGKSITQMSNGIVWFASLKNGIYGIKNDSILYHYTTKNGLMSNNIEQIEADKNTLWIALDNSVQIFDCATQKFKTLTKRDGIISYDISGIEILKNKVYLSSDEGLLSIDKRQPFKKQNNEIYFNAFEINDRDTLVTSIYKLAHDQNTIKIGFNVNGFSFNHKGRYKYRLKGLNDNWLSTDMGINSVKYNSLPAGNYTFQVQPVLENQTENGVIKELLIVIYKPFWQTWWFRLGGLILIFGGTVLFFKKKIRKKEKERIAELEKISLEKELMAINLTALRSQMNPHFIFNVLNSIQDLILQKNTEASYDYIVTFSELIRNALSYSNEDFIPIEKELKFLNVYLKLEKLRFGDTFNYTVNSDIQELIKVPSLLIQPFIENALVHGLMHKKGEKELNISFEFKEECLKCIITDNGIGRKKVNEIYTRQKNKNESFALSAIKKRLDIFKKKYNNNLGYVIEDLYSHEKDTGTKVILTLPFDYDF
ncbi:histidine kinase [Bernardetia sp. OM2101]|uniref:sensor histidine kinase n=1 Tax=Bernardetia sp. OM2101 TaxID=3344876 RepID=UPI0035D01CAD